MIVIFTYKRNIPYHLMSSGWLCWGWYPIRICYDKFIMSSGRYRLPHVSHPDENSRWSLCAFVVKHWSILVYDPHKTVRVIDKLTQKQNGLHFEMHSIIVLNKTFSDLIKCNWGVFPMVQYTVSQHWFRQLLRADQEISHFMNQLGSNRLTYMNHLVSVS